MVEDKRRYRSLPCVYPAIKDRGFTGQKKNIGHQYLRFDMDYITKALAIYLITVSGMTALTCWVILSLDRHWNGGYINE